MRNVEYPVPSWHPRKQSYRTEAQENLELCFAFDIIQTKIWPDENNDFAVRLQTRDLLQKSRFFNLHKGIEEKQTYPKYTSSELIVNIAKSPDDRLKNCS